MFRRTIELPRAATMISVERCGGELRMTYPRSGRLAASGVALGIGLAVGLCLVQLAGEAWTEPGRLALIGLPSVPGLWGLARALRPRPVLRTSGDALVVLYGAALFERMLARLPLETLEMQITETTREGENEDNRAERGEVSPWRRRKRRKRDRPLHTLQVRNSGQALWLSVLASQVASEVENARLALAEAVAGRPVTDVEEVSPSPGSP